MQHVVKILTTGYVDWVYVLSLRFWNTLLRLIRMHAAANA
jgi:hypothetical protein